MDCFFVALKCRVCEIFRTFRFSNRAHFVLPDLVIELICCIETNNRIEITRIKNKYEELQKSYGATTPYQYPLYFLENEEFFHLKWKEARIKTHTPSAKLIRENVEYAYLDNALWNLLQDQQMQEYFRTILVNNFLK